MQNVTDDANNTQNLHEIKVEEEDDTTDNNKVQFVNSKGQIKTKKKCNLDVKRSWKHVCLVVFMKFDLLSLVLFSKKTI